MPKAVVIYGMIDPRTQQLRYVGKTHQSLERRLDAHFTRSNLKPLRHSSRWLSGLRNEGFRPDIFEIECVPAGESWEDAERFWIAYFKFVGADLTNLTIGGEGVGGYRQTLEQRRRMSQAFKGREFSAEHRANISKAKKERGQRPRPLTAEQMLRRGERLKELAAQRTHCRRGHDLAVPGAFYFRSSTKICVECKKMSPSYSPKRGGPGSKRPLMSQEDRRVRRAAAEAGPEVKERRRAAAIIRSANPEWRAAHSQRMTGKPSFIIGEKHPNAKLTWVAVAEIRRRFKLGEKRRVIASDFGVRVGAIDKIVNNVAWRVESDPDQYRPAP